MPKTSNNAELGAVHIRLPFKSMDDVSFSGTYAPLADALVSTLKQHLAKDDEAPETASEPAGTSDSPDDSDDSESDLLRGLKK